MYTGGENYCELILFPDRYTRKKDWIKIIKNILSECEPQISQEQFQEILNLGYYIGAKEIYSAINKYKAEFDYLDADSATEDSMFFNINMLEKFTLQAKANEKILQEIYPHYINILERQFNVFYCYLLDNKECPIEQSNKLLIYLAKVYSFETISRSLILFEEICDRELYQQNDIILGYLELIERCSLGHLNDLFGYKEFVLKSIEGEKVDIAAEHVNLPDELLTEIFNYLANSDLQQLSMTNKFYHGQVKNYQTNIRRSQVNTESVEKTINFFLNKHKIPIGVLSETAIEEHKCYFAKTMRGLLQTRKQLSKLLKDILLGYKYGNLDLQVVDQALRLNPKVLYKFPFAVINNLLPGSEKLTEDELPKSFFEMLFRAGAKDILKKRILPYLYTNILPATNYDVGLKFIIYDLLWQSAVAPRQDVFEILPLEEYLDLELLFISNTAYANFSEQLARFKDFSVKSIEVLGRVYSASIFENIFIFGSVACLDRVISRYSVEELSAADVSLSVNDSHVKSNRRDWLRYYIKIALTYNQHNIIKYLFNNPNINKDLFNKTTITMIFSTYVLSAKMQLRKNKQLHEVEFYQALFIENEGKLNNDLCVEVQVLCGFNNSKENLSLNLTDQFKYTDIIQDLYLGNLPLAQKQELLQQPILADKFKNLAYDSLCEIFIKSIDYEMGVAYLENVATKIKSSMFSVCYAIDLFLQYFMVSDNYNNYALQKYTNVLLQALNSEEYNVYAVLELLAYNTYLCNHDTEKKYHAIRDLLSEHDSPTLYFNKIINKVLPSSSIIEVALYLTYRFNDTNTEKFFTNYLRAVKFKIHQQEILLNVLDRLDRYQIPRDLLRSCRVGDDPTLVLNSAKFNGDQVFRFKYIKDDIVWLDLVLDYEYWWYANTINSNNILHVLYAKIKQQDWAINLMSSLVMHDFDYMSGCQNNFRRVPFLCAFDSFEPEAMCETLLKQSDRLRMIPSANFINEHNTNLVEHIFPLILPKALRYGSVETYTLSQKQLMIFMTLLDLVVLRYYGTNHRNQLSELVLAKVFSILAILGVGQEYITDKIVYLEYGNNLFHLLSESLVKFYKHKNTDNAVLNFVADLLNINNVDWLFYFNQKGDIPLDILYDISRKANLNNIVRKALALKNNDFNKLTVCSDTSGVCLLDILTNSVLNQFNMLSIPKTLKYKQHCRDRNTAVFSINNLLAIILFAYREFPNPSLSDLSKLKRFIAKNTNLTQTVTNSNANLLHVLFVKDGTIKITTKRMVLRYIFNLFTRDDILNLLQQQDSNGNTPIHNLIISYGFTEQAYKIVFFLAEELFHYPGFSSINTVNNNTGDSILDICHFAADKYNSKQSYRLNQSSDTHRKNIIKLLTNGASKRNLLIPNSERMNLSSVGSKRQRQASFCCDEPDSDNKRQKL